MIWDPSQIRVAMYIRVCMHGRTNYEELTTRNRWPVAEHKCTENVCTENGVQDVLCTQRERSHKLRVLFFGVLQPVLFVHSCAGGNRRILQNMDNLNDNSA